MRWRALAATVSAVCGLLSGATTGVHAQQPADPVPPRTPSLGEVFNGYVVGSMTGGHFVSPEQILQGLAADDPFYVEPPMPRHPKPGTLLKAEPVDVQYLGLRPAHLSAYKLMYVTTGINGVTPVISTGILMIPRDGIPVAAKKVISYQEANDSIGWSCHPSTQWTGGDPIDGASWSALGPLALMFGRGYAVMISDVGNDADRRPHGIFAGRFAGHAQLDGVRAALQYRRAGLDPHPQIALFGIAGGGVGAGFAAEMQPRYAPELDVRSVVLQGMVVDPRNFMRVADGSIGSGFAMATLLGLEPWYPAMNIDPKLNPLGTAVAQVYRTECQTAYFTLPFVPLRALFNTGLSPADEPSFQHAFADNTLGRVGTPRSRVLISSCARDDSLMSLVPARDAANLAQTYRARGARVDYIPTDCSMVRMLVNLYGWGTDLFGMQTIRWLASNFG